MARAQLSSVIQFLRRTVGAVPSEEPTDRQLLAQFASRRDEDAFAALARRHGPMVLAVCRRVLGDDHAAEDAFQAAFLVLARKAGSAGWHESVGSWLYQVAYRVAQKARGDAARRRLHERQVSDMATAEVDASALRHELRTILDEELTRLPEKYRAPLVLCYLEGMTNEEAAALLGWTKGTVSGRLARARDLLRGRLTRRGLALSGAALPAAVTETAGAAIVPAALLDTTIRAAATGASVAPVAALAEGVLRTMFLTKLKIAGVVLLMLGVVGAGTGIATYRALAEGQATAIAKTPLPEPKQTKTAPEDKLIISKPVRVNGVDFEVVTERRWLAPPVAPEGKTSDRPIELGLRITNRTAKELVFFNTASVRVNSPDGKKLPVDGGGHEQIGRLRSIAIAPGKSANVMNWVGLQRIGDDTALAVQWHYGYDYASYIRSLQPGRKYDLSLTYATPEKSEFTNQKDGKGCRVGDIENVWQGQVRTAAVPVEIVGPALAKAPLPEPNRSALVPEEKTIASKPVRVNGVDFEVVTERRWLAPSVAPDGKLSGRPVELGLRIRNRTTKELVFSDLVQVRVKSADGKEVPVEHGGIDQIGVLRSIVIGAGKSAIVPAGHALSRSGAGMLKLHGGVEGVDPWSVQPLEVGRKYVLCLRYTSPEANENVLHGKELLKAKDIQNVWQGQVRTAEVPVEIVEKAAK